jgi:hypothetical protein
MSHQKTSEPSRLALIDAEILRCEMALAEKEGGGLRAWAGSRRRGGSRSKSRERQLKPDVGFAGGTLPWKERLGLVGKLVMKINKTGVAPRLYANLVRHLSGSIANLKDVNIGDDDAWEKVVDELLDCKEFYIDKADTLSVYDVSQSPYHLFDAIASGMEISVMEAKGLDSSDKRGKWLEQLLGNIGNSIGILARKPGYFDAAISKGSGEVFMQIARVLQGVKVSGVSIEGGGTVGRGDWRGALVSVLAKVRDLDGMVENPIVKLIYDQVVERLDATVTKMTSNSVNAIKDPTKWAGIYVMLDGKKKFFLLYSSGSPVGPMFKAIGTALKKSIGTAQDWNLIRVSERDRVMCSILRGIGGNLASLRREDYNFLPEGGAKIIGEIADILQNV